MRAQQIAKEWIETTVISLLIVLAFYIFFWPVEIVGNSMENSFSDGDRVCMSRIQVFFKQLDYGDLVICNLPDKDIDIIKRLIALPGDEVIIKGGFVYVNDKKIAEPYIKEAYTYGDLYIVLKEDEYFILGDNRNGSYDSREIGPLTFDKIKGKVIVRWYPFKSITLLDTIFIS